jgi:diguanylate cyclase (GGDEF)-like protein
MTLVDGTGEGDAPVLVHAVDVTEQRLAERRMRHLADHDPLTGLLNRRGFAAAMQTQIAQSHRYRTAGALLVLDLDGFKAVNDTHGHDAGDKLLVRVADELRACLRVTDVLARLGGDEFAVILPRETLDEAAVVAAKITDRLRATGVRVTASVGVAPFSAEYETGDDVMRAADLAMYSAKAAGRDRHALAGRHPDLV